mgnify:CR=1 FL=1
MLCLAAALLAGCALSRPPDQKEVIQQALPEGTDIPSQWSTETNAAAVTDEWLKSFNDPTLEALSADVVLDLGGKEVSA